MKTPGRLLVVTGLLILMTLPAWALVPERRKVEGSEELGWFFAPTPARIEGVGQAIPLFGLLTNFYEGADMIAVKTLPGGDFDITVAVLNDFPVFTRHFLFKGGYFQQEVAFNLYSRGIDSQSKDYIVPYIKQSGNFWDFRYVGWEERVELFYRQFEGKGQQTKVFDAKGNLLSDVVTKTEFSASQYGYQLDLTDENIDPRIGVRFGQKYSPNTSKNAFTSDVTLIDSEINFYLPLRESDTIAFNFFTSLSQINRAGVTDEATARTVLSQNCASGDFACSAAEDKLVADALAYNRHGSTSLGGPNRLRAYAMNRFTAGNSNFRGVEYRYNFDDKANPLNWGFIGGTNSLLQMAFFFEQGTVSDERSQLLSNMKPSYGMGFRSLISGFIYRLDLAQGDEGLGVTLFIDYPMQLLPITE